MLKKITSILLSCLLLFSFFSFYSFASATPNESSFVTFKANMPEKVAAYYSHVEVTVCNVDNPNMPTTYTFKLFNYNDFTYKASLPNGKYVLVGGGIPNEINQDPITPQEFVVGQSPNVLVEFNVNKDMSEYPDRTTAPVQTLPPTTPQSTTSPLQGPSSSQGSHPSQGSSSSSSTQSNTNINESNTNITESSTNIDEANTNTSSSDTNIAEPNANVSENTQEHFSNTTTPSADPPQKTFDWQSALSVVISIIFAIGVILLIVYFVKRQNNE